MVFLRSTVRKINILLSAAAAGAAVLLVYSIGTEVEFPTEAGRIEPVPEAVQEEKKPFEHYSLISQSNVFGAPRREAPAREPAGRPPPPEPSPPSMTLKGTVLFSSGEGFAVVRLGSEEKTVKKGGLIEGMELISVGWDSAVFRGPRGELELTIDSSSAASAQTTSPARPAAVEPGSRTRGPGAAVAVDSSLFDEMIRNPARFMREVNVRPGAAPDGTAGFIVSGIRPGSIADELGLRNNDLISSVNRTPLDSPDNLMRIYNQVVERGAASVEVIRDGRRVNLRYSTER